MGLASRPLTLTRLEDAQRYTIGAVRSDVGEQLLLNAGFDEQKIMTTNRLSQALRMLTSGRVELISSNKSPCWISSRPSSWIPPSSRCAGC